jgi:hypothetical protein
MGPSARLLSQQRGNLGGAVDHHRLRRARQSRPRQIANKCSHAFTQTTPNEGETLSIVKTIGVAVPARGQ